MGWAMAAVVHDPSPAWENEVVMPQVGQGWSNQTTQVHLFMPSWVWVACPEGSGESQAAVMRTNRVTAAIAAAPMRSPVVERSGVVRSFGCTAWTVKWCSTLGG